MAKQQVSKSKRRDKRVSPGRGAAALGQVDRATRLTVLLRFAVLTSSGRPVLCLPSPYREQPETRGAGCDGKVVFGTREAAESAGRELARLPGGRPMEAYPCRRSRHGHHHLATDRARLGRQHTTEVA